jgi:hypothetical protein
VHAIILENFVTVKLIGKHRIFIISDLQTSGLLENSKLEKANKTQSFSQFNH